MSSSDANAATSATAPSASCVRRADEAPKLRDDLGSRVVAFVDLTDGFEYIRQRSGGEYCQGLILGGRPAGRTRIRQGHNPSDDPKTAAIAVRPSSCSTTLRPRGRARLEGP